jgi:hypothetical protein
VPLLVNADSIFDMEALTGGKDIYPQFEIHSVFKLVIYQVVEEAISD